MPINDPLMIVGLFQNVQAQEVFDWQDGGNQVWAINDFYMRHPWLRPNAIWQVHKPEDIKPNYEIFRWLGNWRSVYESAGVPVYSMYEDPGCEYDLQVVDCDTFPKSFTLLSSIDYMLAHAELMGIKHIEIRGLYMLDNPGERDFQVRSMVNNIKAMKERGIQIGTSKWQDKPMLEHWDEAAPPALPRHIMDVGLHYHERPPVGETVSLNLKLDEKQRNPFRYHIHGNPGE